MADDRGGNQEGRHEPGDVLEQQNGDDGHHLGNGFQLAPVVGGDDPALFHRQQADGRDGEFPDHDQQHADREGQIQLHQTDQGGDHQDLVRQGVHQLAEIGDQVVPPGDFPVQMVCVGRPAE